MKNLRSVALPGALFLLGAAFLATGLLPWQDFLALAGRTIPILAFVVAMTVVTELADDAGVFRFVTDRLAHLGGDRPAYLALEPVAASPLRFAALLIGVNLGPLVSPWASLATLLWHERLGALGVSVSWAGFAVAGLAAVAVTLPLAVLALWLSAGLPG